MGIQFTVTCECTASFFCLVSPHADQQCGPFPGPSDWSSTTQVGTVLQMLVIASGTSTCAVEKRQVEFDLKWERCSDRQDDGECLDRTWTVLSQLPQIYGVNVLYIEQRQRLKLVHVTEWRYGYLLIGGSVCYNISTRHHRTLCWPIPTKFTNLLL